MAKIGEREWEQLIDEIVETYLPNDLLPHKKLSEIFYLPDPVYNDYASQDEFMQAVKLQQFEYMTLVDKLRWDILKKHKLYLQNVRGDGYSFVAPGEQTDFAKDQAMEKITKHTRRGLLILKNIRFNDLSADQRRHNSDELAKIGQLSQMLKIIR